MRTETNLMAFESISKGESSGLRIPTIESKVAQSSIEELFESTYFYETFKRCKLDCAIRSSSDELVYALTQNFLKQHEPARQVTLQKITTIFSFLLFF